MSTQVLEQQLEAKDVAAPETARRLGAEATAVVVRYLAHPDGEVREIALEARFVLEDAGRNAALIRALRDEDLNVSSAALRHLNETAGPAEVDSLVAEVRSNPDEYVRGHVALIVGKLGEPSAVPKLREAYDSETDEDSRDRIELALARLKDEDARMRIRSGLTASGPKTRLEAVQKYEYIHDVRALADLQSALGDREEVLNINPPHATPSYIRLCDVAINVSASTGSPVLSFDPGERRRFSEAEIGEVSRWLAELSR